jgi:hypothetical protein
LASVRWSGSLIHDLPGIVIDVPDRARMKAAIAALADLPRDIRPGD